jgi:hypothetical protein
VVAVDGAGRSAAWRLTLSAGNVSSSRDVESRRARVLCLKPKSGEEMQPPPRRLGSFRGAAIAALRLTGSRAPIGGGAGSR